MAVYVDDLNVRADVPDGAKMVRGRWSHLFADTEEELRAFAARIGLKDSWIQHPGEPRVHFDVAGRMRQRAIAAGARPVTWREAGEFFAGRARQALIPADRPVTSLLLVSGPREGVSKETVRAALAPKFSESTLLVTGGAGGVDTCAAQLWREWGGLVEEHPVPAAEWNSNPRGAGVARNGRMVQRVKTAGGTVLVIDLPCARPGCTRARPHNTHGTSHCAGIAERAGLAVEHYQAPPAKDAAPRARRESRVPATGDDGNDAPGAGRRRALRQAAHLYLGHGLLPVPGWAAKASGGCCCPRGADCPRPGKHPRSVHTGPRPHDYSWKPLACRTHADVDQRFAGDGEYAGANLMLAIPAGMLVIDQDDDDGGPQAVATLAGQLGELPATLTHRTPHGSHRIYRTPPGWTGRGWVGKDARNPLPAGIDLRVPGQILMAPPSQVPVPGGLATYGPPSGTGVAGLPAAYLSAWTPPQPQAGRARRAVPVPPDRAGTAASYVHAKVSGIIAGLAAHEPGGRNTAIYTAALKVGSTLGAARTTPGAGHAAAEWTDEAAEDALTEAAERNGYIGQHSAADARTAIRSGLRNGLRNPRPLPDFTARPAAQPPRPENARTRRGPEGGARPAGQAQTASAARSRDASPAAGQGSSARTRRASRREAPTARSVSAVLRAAGYTASSHDRAAYGPEGYRVQAAPDGGILIRHIAIAEPINGATPSARIEQMLTRYGHALQAAGFNVTSPARGSLAVTPREAGRPAAQVPAPASHGQDRQAQASRVAAAADEAYRAGELDRARQLTGQAAELDPDRAGLWQQHRAEIAARRLIARAREAGAEGDQGRANKLLEDARELDPRMQMLWNRHLTGINSSQPARQAPIPAAAGNGRNHHQHARQPARERSPGRATGPQWPGRPARGPEPGPDVPGRTHAEPQPPGPGDPPAPAGPSGKGAGPEQRRVRHSWEPAGEGARRCTREGCGLEATQRLHPTERRWLTSYAKGGRAIIAGRVPACGEDLPQGRSAEEMRHLAAVADRQAGHAFRSGDIDRAYRLLTDARALDPGRQELWDQHEQQIRESVAKRQPRQVSQDTETAACPKCGKPYVRPVGEAYPCLGCESETRLKAAGFTPGGPELKKIAGWDRAAIRGVDRQQEMAQQPEPGTPEPGPQSPATLGHVGQVKVPDREKEACG